MPFLHSTRTPYYALSPIKKSPLKALPPIKGDPYSPFLLHKKEPLITPFLLSKGAP